MSRRLSTIAKWINENLPELRAVVVDGYCNTDRKIGRLRWPGKGRYGNRLVVRRATAPYAIVKDHNAAETYRSNDEVERWLAAWVAGKCTCRGYETHDDRCRLAGDLK